MDVSENSGFPPKSSILIGFSIIFTIHFGVPLFLDLKIMTKKPKWLGTVKVVMVTYEFHQSLAPRKSCTFTRWALTGYKWISNPYKFINGLISG